MSSLRLATIGSSTNHSVILGGVGTAPTAVAAASAALRR
jgi:hypothetical protein